MKKMHFNKLFIISAFICATPTYVLMRYLEGANFFASSGIGNTVLMSVVVSLLPALLISICWWNYQHDDDE